MKEASGFEYLQNSSDLIHAIINWVGGWEGGCVCVCVY